MALALDGAVNDSNIAVSVSLSLTTSLGSGVIVVIRMDDSGAGSINPPTATGLTFTLRDSMTTVGGHRTTWWTAPHTGNFSGTITVPTADGSIHFVEGTAFGVAEATGAFDSGAGIPAKVTGTSNATITTADNGDFIFWAGHASGTGGSGTNAGYTNIVAYETQLMSAYKVGNAGTYSVAMNPGVNVDNGNFIDALSGAAAATTTLMGQICL